jgi:cytoskeletal protein CcmA (bactofilin family)
MTGNVSSMKNSPGDYESRLGATVAIRGTVHVRQARVDVSGKIEGVIDHDHDLQINEHAEIDAEVCGREILVNGSVRGEIYGLEKVVIGGAGHVEGDIYTRVFAVEEGATLEGSVIMEAAGGAVEQRFRARHPAGLPMGPAIVVAEPSVGARGAPGTVGDESR